MKLSFKEKALKEVVEYELKLTEMYTEWFIKIYWRVDYGSIKYFHPVAQVY